MSNTILATVLQAIRQGQPAALVTQVQGPMPGAKCLVTPSMTLGSLGDVSLDQVATRDARSMLFQGATGVRHYGPDGQERGDSVEVFVQSFGPPPRMYIFGAIDFSRALVRIAKLLGYHVTVCDPRTAFATHARFPEADELVVQWPHEFLANAEVDERTALCVLTHDPKFDVPALKAAVKTPAGYIGAMGSRATHREHGAGLVDRDPQVFDLIQIEVQAGRLARRGCPEYR